MAGQDRPSEEVLRVGRRPSRGPARYGGGVRAGNMPSEAGRPVAIPEEARSGLGQPQHRGCSPGTRAPAKVQDAIASQDGNLTFEDLGNAVSKCRTDFGAKIDINVDSLRRDKETKLSKAHCVVGTVRYSDESEGTLLYIKPTLTGDEPADVMEYHTAHPEFPHDPTTDQFFTESQFESYRQLGYHIATKVFEVACRDSGPETVDEASLKDEALLKNVFDKLERRWYPSSAFNEKSFTRLADKFEQLNERLRSDVKLASLDAEFYPEAEFNPKVERAEPAMKGATPVLSRDGFYYCNSLIQLMEDVYLDLRLEDQYNHPDNQGWINTFFRWSESPTFRVTWLINNGLFGKRFRSFMSDRLRLGQGKPEVGTQETSEGELLVCDLYLRSSDPGLRVKIGSVKKKKVDGTDTIVYISIDKPYRRLGLASLALRDLKGPFNIDLEGEGTDKEFDAAAADALKRTFRNRWM